MPQSAPGLQHNRGTLRHRPHLSNVPASRHPLAHVASCAQIPPQRRPRRPERATARRVGACAARPMTPAAKEFTMKIDLRTLDQIRPYDKNPRQNDEAVEAVAASL